MKTLVRILSSAVLLGAAHQACVAAAVDVTVPALTESAMAKAPHYPDAQGCCRPNCCFPKVSRRKTLYVGNGLLELSVKYKGPPRGDDTILLILYNAAGDTVLSRTILPEREKETYRLTVNCEDAPHSVTVWCTPGARCYQTKVVSGECSQ